MNYSTFTDRLGRVWNIPELLASERPRSLHLEAVSALLTPLLSDERWGPEGGTVRDVLTLAQAMCDSASDEEVPYGDGTIEEHAARIASMRLALEKGWVPEPLVLGLDGGLWDGMHRLSALFLAKREHTRVFDFSIAAQVDLETVLRNIRAELIEKLSDDSLSIDKLAERRRSFLQAEGYPRCFIPEFLKSTFAARCLHALDGLSWYRHETDFYKQDEFLLGADDCALPESLHELRDFLLSEAFISYWRILSGNQLLFRPEVCIRRMTRGDYVGIHNDYRREGERFRCILYLGSTGQDLAEGAFVALADERGSRVLDVHYPAHNSLLAFSITPRSFHLVTEVQTASRFTVVLSLYEATAPEDLNVSP